MTKEELQPHLEALGLYLREGEFDGEYWVCSQKTLLKLNEHLGIELVPEAPEINIQNLGRFMVLHGEYPEATGVAFDGNIFEGVLTFISCTSYEISGQEVNSVQITDPRWLELEV